MVTNKINYKDKSVLIILVVVVSIIFSNIGSSNGFWRWPSFNTVAVNFLYTTIAVLMLREIVHLLDKYFPWNKGMTKRFLIQIFISLLCYFIIQSIILYIIEPEANNAQIESDISYTTFAIGAALVIFMNMLYLLLYIRQKESSIKNIITPLSKESDMFIIGSQAGKKTSIPFHQLTYFHLDNSITRGLDKSGILYSFQETLSNIEEIANEIQFFRANRQHIISREIIRNVTYNRNKTCSVHLLHLDLPIIISRYNTPKFKKWLSLKTLATPLSPL